METYSQMQSATASSGNRRGTPWEQVLGNPGTSLCKSSPSSADWNPRTGNDQGHRPPASLPGPLPPQRRTSLILKHYKKKPSGTLGITFSMCLHRVRINALFFSTFKRLCVICKMTILTFRPNYFSNSSQLLHLHFQRPTAAPKESGEFSHFSSWNVWKNSLSAETDDALGQRTHE